MIAAGNALLGIAIACALCGVAAMVMIAGELQKRGVKINWIWLRVFIATKYLGQYRNVTRRETGRPGPLYYAFLIAMNLALVTAIIGLVLRAL